MPREQARLACRWRSCGDPKAGRRIVASAIERQPLRCRGRWPKGALDRGGWPPVARPPVASRGGRHHDRPGDWEVCGIRGFAESGGSGGRAICCRRCSDIAESARFKELSDLEANYSGSSDFTISPGGVQLKAVFALGIGFHFSWRRFRRQKSRSTRVEDESHGKNRRQLELTAMIRPYFALNTGRVGSLVAKKVLLAGTPRFSPPETEGLAAQPRLRRRAGKLHALVFVRRAPKSRMPCGRLTADQRPRWVAPRRPQVPGRSGWPLGCPRPSGAPRACALTEVGGPSRSGRSWRSRPLGG